MSIITSAEHARYPCRVKGEHAQKYLPNTTRRVVTAADFSPAVRAVPAKRRRRSLADGRLDALVLYVS